MRRLASLLLRALATCAVLGVVGLVVLVVELSGEAPSDGHDLLTRLQAMPAPPGADPTWSSSRGADDTSPAAASIRYALPPRLSREHACWAVLEILRAGGWVQAPRSLSRARVERACPGSAWGTRVVGPNGLEVTVSVVSEPQPSPQPPPLPQLPPTTELVYSAGG